MVKKKDQIWLRNGERKGEAFDKTPFACYNRTVALMRKERYCLKHPRTKIGFAALLLIGLLLLSGCGNAGGDTTSQTVSQDGVASAVSQTQGGTASGEDATSSVPLTEVQPGNYSKSDVDWPELEARDTGADSPYGYYSIVNILTIYNTDSSDGEQEPLTDVGLDLVISEDNTVTIYELDADTGEIMINTMPCTIAEELNEDGLLEIDFTYEGTQMQHTLFYSPDAQTATEYTTDLVYIFQKNLPDTQS